MWVCSASSTTKRYTSAWFLPSLGELSLWWPINAMIGQQVDWGVIAQSSAEIGSFCGVMAIALLLDVSSLEVARQKTSDLDQEFRSNGLANLLASVLGGFGGSLSMNACLLLDESGATTRWAGAIVGIVCAIILFSGTDVGSMVPKAILAGMLAYLGAVILIELWEAPAQSSWMEWALTGVMTLVIINFGYFMGVVIGVIGACLMFALSYSRIGVIRRHLTRQEFSSNVERSPEQTRLLREEGKRVHVFWLSGFIFFGSSNGLFERIKRAIEAQREKPVGYVVLDFSAVPGLDTSAVLSLVKLRNYCEENGVTLGFSGLSDIMRASFEKADFFGSERPHQVFGSRNEAIEWCEDMLLMYHEVGDASTHSFESWLQSEFGEKVEFEKIAPYMQRQELEERRVPVPPGRAVGFRGAASLGLGRHHHHRRARAADPAAAHDRAYGGGRDGLLSRRAAHGERHRRGADRDLPADARSLRPDAGGEPNRGSRAAQAHHQAAVGPPRIRQSRNFGAALGRGGDHQNGDDAEIGQPVHQLVGAEREPEATVAGRPAVAVGELLLQPIDVIVHHELAEREAGGNQQRAGQQHQIDQRRQRGMDAGVDEAARMAVLPLVQDIDTASADKNRRPHA